MAEARAEPWPIWFKATNKNPSNRAQGVRRRRCKYYGAAAFIPTVSSESWQLREPPLTSPLTCNIGIMTPAYPPPRLVVRLRQAQVSPHEQETSLFGKTNPDVNFK